MSPPTQRGGAPPPQGPARERSGHDHVTEQPQHNSSIGHAVADVSTMDYVAALRRRRAASLRCPPMPDGRRDPLDDRTLDACSDRELDSWVTAVAHLSRLNLYSPQQVPSAVTAALRRCRSGTCGRGDAA
jgi:hypothetical protein